MIVMNISIHTKCSTCYLSCLILSGDCLSLNHKKQYMFSLMSCAVWGQDISLHHTIQYMLSFMSDTVWGLCISLPQHAIHAISGTVGNCLSLYHKVQCMFLILGTIFKHQIKMFQNQTRYLRPLQLWGQQLWGQQVCPHNYGMSPQYGSQTGKMSPQLRFFQSMLSLMSVHKLVSESHSIVFN